MRRADIADGRGVGIGVAVLGGQDGAHGADDVVDITIAEQTGTAGKDGQEACAGGLGVFEGGITVVWLEGGGGGGGGVLGRARLLPEAKDHGGPLTC